jgi:hypothetical protein
MPTGSGLIRSGTIRNQPAGCDHAECHSDQQGKSNLWDVDGDDQCRPHHPEAADPGDPDMRHVDDVRGNRLELGATAQLG